MKAQERWDEQSEEGNLQAKQPPPAYDGASGTARPNSLGSTKGNEDQRDNQDAVAPIPPQPQTHAPTRTRLSLVSASLKRIKALSTGNLRSPPPQASPPSKDETGPVREGSFDAPSQFNEKQLKNTVKIESKVAQQRTRFSWTKGLSYRTFTGRSTSTTGPADNSVRQLERLRQQRVDRARDAKKKSEKMLESRLSSGSLGRGSGSSSSSFGKAGSPISPPLMPAIDDTAELPDPPNLEQPTAL